MAAVRVGIIPTKLFDVLPAATILHTFVQYFIAFCSRPEAPSDVISGRSVGPVVPDKCVKACDPRLNRSQEIPPKAIRGSICEFFRDNFQPEEVGDVTAGVAVEM